MHQKKKRQNPKAKQIKGTNYVTAKFCCLCNASLLLGLLSPSSSNRRGQPRTHQVCRQVQQCEEDTGLGHPGSQVCDPPQQRYLGSGNRFTPSLNGSLRGSFVAILEGFPACIQAGSLLGRWECSQDQLEHSQGISDLCWRKLRAEVSCGLLWLVPSPTGPLQFTGSALCLGGMSQQAGQ